MRKTEDLKSNQQLNKTAQQARDEAFVAIYNLGLAKRGNTRIPVDNDILGRKEENYDHLTP